MDRPVRMTELPPLRSDRFARLDAHARSFHNVFSRTDQLNRLTAYLHGLLAEQGPKNVEAIATRLAGASTSGNLSQALQHFISSSPWDAFALLARYRSLLPQHRNNAGRLWLVQDVVFPKKGRHSVGTQRQFARPLARKINCQIAVALSEIGPEGFFPLSIRLYLPGYWLREHGDLVERTVPPEHRQHLSKADIAVNLIDEVRGEGGPDLVTGDEGYLTSTTFSDALSERGIKLLQPQRVECDALGETDRGFDWLKQQLGLDQFEGRNWLGWHHHAALVFAAYGFLALEQTG